MNDTPWCSTPAISDSYTTSRRSSAFRLRGGRVLTWWTSGVESDLTSGLSGRASKSTQSRLTDLVARENGPRDDNLSLVGYRPVEKALFGERMRRQTQPQHEEKERLAIASPAVV